MEGPEQLAEQVAIFYLELVGRGVPDYVATTLAQTYMSHRLIIESNSTHPDINQLFRVQYGGNNESTGV